MTGRTDMSTSPSETRSADGDPHPVALSVAGVRKRFGASVAVDGVDLAVREHEVVCLVGPSGCGKSTVLRMVAGLVRPDEGEIWLGARLLHGPSTTVAPERRGIGIVFQDHALFPNLTVAGNVAFGLNRLDRASRRRQADAMLELVGLGRHADRFPHELSGGERQRVALARALAPEPAVLLLDEPFASLDHNLRVQIRADVMRILRSTGTPSVFVTHDQGEALALGDRVVVLRDGRVEQVGSPREVFHAPVNRFVASFMGDADFLPVEVVDGRLRSEIGAHELRGRPPGGPLVVVLRPDEVTFTVGGDGSAVVEWREFEGSSVLYGIRLASSRLVRSRRSHSVEVEIGTPVAVGLAETGVVATTLSVSTA